ncbi:hypothetical protein [Paenibacillus apiarius]|uniref:hypothetical protein n=1 Tax=Paenibacillus apiarius TaxID=46240 RepID=UPI003B3B7901
MGNGFEQTIYRLISLYPDDESVKDRLQNIAMKSAFRAPELEHMKWTELAQFIKTLQIDQLALLLSSQSKAIYFNDGEKEELQRALSKHITNIHKFTESDKTIEDDKAGLAKWLENTRTALEKLKED